MHNADTRPTGKPYQVALNEDLAEVTGTLKYYAGYADKIHGQVIDTTPNKLAYTIREPIGVCGQIIPWNYPLGKRSPLEYSLSFFPSANPSPQAWPRGSWVPPLLAATPLS